MFPFPVNGRVDQPGGYGVDPYTHGTEVTGDWEGHSHHAAFGGGVGGLADLAVKRSGGGHVDDSAAAAVRVHGLGLRHGRRSPAQHIESADQVDLDDKGELVEIKWHVVAVDSAAGGAQAGGVDAGAQGGKFAGGGYRRVGVLGFGNVALDEDTADFRGDFTAALFVEVGIIDPGSSRGLLARSGFADTGSATGYD